MDVDKNEMVEAIESPPESTESEPEKDIASSIVIAPLLPPDERGKESSLKGGDHSEDEPPRATPRRTFLDDSRDMAGGLGLRARTLVSHMMQSGRVGNQRRSQQLGPLFLLLFAANVLIIGAFGVWFYNMIAGEMDMRLANVKAPPPAPLPIAKAEPNPEPPPKGLSPEEFLQGQEKLKSEIQSELKSQIKKEIADLQAQLQAAQKRLTNAEEMAKLTISRVRELASTAHKESGPSPVVAAALPANTVPGNALAAESLTPSQSELVLLKERNRLTALADEAIATASRETYERLWEALDDPRLSNLIHAARAEILRVQNYYLSGSRLQKYEIPVLEIFPDSAAMRDTQLSDDQLIKILGDQKQTWQNRVKAAWLLGQRRSTKAGEALVGAIKQDANLDVVKEATFSFEQLTGYHAKLFEVASLESWWKEYNAMPPPLIKAVTNDTPPKDGTKTSTSVAKP